MNGQDKYRRFARMVPTQETQLAMDITNVEKNRKSMENDLSVARRILSPQARKKKTEFESARKSSKSKRVEKFEARIIEKTGTRKEQLARLPKTKKEDGNIREEK